MKCCQTPRNGSCMIDMESRGSGKGAGAVEWTIFSPISLVVDCSISWVARVEVAMAEEEEKIWCIHSSEYLDAASDLYFEAFLTIETLLVSVLDTPLSWNPLHYPSELHVVCRAGASHVELVNLETTKYFARLFELRTLLALFPLFCSLIMFGSSNLEKPSTANYYLPGRFLGNWRCSGKTWIHRAVSAGTVVEPHH